ncbi:MAG TPA: ADP/ATP-dependent (S)-NAD(P)H-hydrate dehydratase [Lacisediminihabitans sp.]|uniref:ADP-dependent NAD(P)H-hydrate dehydratase n=1 Tax=Lacisediminihabitans sp. TaxID=2787631 RepID=UPI002ED7DE08
MSTFTDWTAADATEQIAVPTPEDDKYSRGVLGVITGSAEYPGAAVLGVEAALRTGLGMVRYLGAPRAADFVLHRRPETVTADGRVQAWLIGSGMDAATRDAETGDRLTAALAQGLPTVIDAGALDLLAGAVGPVVVTPHFGELARLVDASKEQIGSNPAAWAVQAAEQLGVTVLLKGNSTYVAAPDGTRIVTRSAPSWLATAGAGDALGGILGALVATHSREVAAETGALARLAATASVIHGLAAERASGGGPFTVLDLAAEIPAVVAGLLRG